MNSVAIHVQASSYSVSSQYCLSVCLAFFLKAELSNFVIYLSINEQRTKILKPCFSIETKIMLTLKHWFKFWFTIFLNLGSVAPGLHTRHPWLYSPLVKICLDNYHSEHLLLALSIHIKSTEHWGTLPQCIWPFLFILILNNHNFSNHLICMYMRWLLKSQSEFIGQATLSATF